MTVQVDSNGVQAVGYQFNNDCAKATPWQARWIWTDAQPSPLAAMFRKTVILNAHPQKVKAWLSADIKYLLYVLLCFRDASKASSQVDFEHLAGG